MTVTPTSTWLAAATRRLQDAGVTDPAREARLLLRWAMNGRNGSVHGVDVMPDPVQVRAEAALARRAGRTPLSHITGRRDFWAHSFLVTADVLDPRPDTETLVATVLDGPPPSTIVDVGTGSGCILLSLLAEWPSAVGCGVDISTAALAVANDNALALGLADRVSWLSGEWLAPVTEPVDLIVSNPPYLSCEELSIMQPELQHEPRAALDGGVDGLDAYRAIVFQASRLLKTGGRLAVEIGATQGEPVLSLFAQHGFNSLAIHADLNRRARVVAGKAPETAL